MFLSSKNMLKFREFFCGSKERFTGGWEIVLIKPVFGLALPGQTVVLFLRLGSGHDFELKWQGAQGRGAGAPRGQSKQKCGKR